MKSFFRRHKLISLFVLLALTFGIAAALMPWQKVLEGQLKSMLSARGFQNVDLNIAGLGWKGIILENINFGGDTKLTLRNVAIDYTLPEIRQKIIGGLTVSGLDLQARKIDGKWVVAGLEGVVQSPSAEKKEISIPVTVAELGFIPFNRLSVEDSHIAVISDTWQIALPVAVKADKLPVPKIAYEAAQDVQLKFGTMEAVARDVRADLTLSESEKRWSGAWAVDKMEVTGLPETVPALKGSGTISLDAAARITVNGHFISADKKYSLDFRYEDDLNQLEKAKLTIIKGGLPWKGGAIGVQNVQMLLKSAKQPISFNLQVKSVSIDELLQTLTGKRVSATGLVSGSVPVVIARDGGLTIKKGTLKAHGPGVIHMPPDAIPGDNQQIELVRNILSDLQYSQFSINTEGDTKNNFAVLLALEGHNPDVYNGRAVKLNVRLTGDVLDFIQQNLMLLNNPEKLLKAGQE